MGKSKKNWNQNNHQRTNPKWSKTLRTNQSTLTSTIIGNPLKTNAVNEWIWFLILNILIYYLYQMMAMVDSIGKYVIGFLKMGIISISYVKMLYLL